MEESYTGGPERRSSRALVSELLRGRWPMLFAATLIMSAAGPSFGQYSAEIKLSLEYNHTTLNLLSFFKDLGLVAGVVAGVINKFSPPWVCLSIGAVLNFAGYFMIWLAISKKISTPHVWQMCLYICTGSSSQSFISTAAVVTTVKNFRAAAIVSGLLTGFAGLSGAIITQLSYAVLHEKDSKSLILLIAGLPTATSLVFLPVIRIKKDVANDDRVRVSYVFYRFLYISLGLAAFLLVIIVLQNKLRFTRTGYVLTATAVFTLLLLPIAIVVKEEFDVLRKPQKEDSDKINVENTKPEETTLANLQALVSVDMLFLFLATVCGIGGALTAIDNLGQIGVSLGYPTNIITTCVSLVSIWNYLGRVVAGFLSEHLLIEYKFPRPLMLTAILVLSSIGHFLIAFDAPNGLYVASAIIGFCFGAQWLLLSATISDLFGLDNSAVSLASPIGSYLFKVRVAAHLYDIEANKQLKAPGRSQEAFNSCIGAECFKLAFLIIAVVTVFGTAVSLLLAVRTMKFYRSGAYAKFQHEAPAAAVVEANVAAASAPA